MHLIIKNQLSLFIIVVFTALLQGCAAVLPTTSTNPLDAPPSVGEGTVIVTVTTNSAQLSYVNRIILEQVLAPEAQANNAKAKAPLQYYVVTVETINRDTSFLAGNVPAGEYNIVALEGGNHGRINTMSSSFSLRDFNHNLIGPIKVEPNQIADLGRLVVSAINLNAGVGRSKKYSDNLEHIHRLFPNWSSSNITTIESGWVQPRSEVDIVEAFATLHPIGMNAIADLTDGYVGGASRMGTVHIRTPTGAWKTIAQSPEYLPIRSIAVYPSEEVRLVAGGELGQIYKITNGGEFIPVNTGNLLDGDVEFIRQDPVSKRWYVGVRKERDLFTENTEPKLAVYYSESLESGQWEHLIEASIAWDGWSGATFAWVWALEGGLGFASTETNSVHCYNFATESWTQNLIPEKQRLIGLASGANNAIGIVTGKKGGFAGVFANTYYTTDCGEKWVQTFSPYKVKASAPIMLADGTVLEAGGVFRDGGIYASKTPWLKEGWDKIVDGAILADAMYLTEEGDLIMVSNGQYGWEKIQGSQDGGKTWVIEKSSYSQKMQEAIDAGKK